MKNPPLVGLIMAFLQALLNLVVSFGADLTGDQMTAINVAVSCLLALVFYVLHLLGKEIPQ